MDVREEIARAKYIPQDELDKISEIRNTIDNQIKSLQVTAA
jgi:V/A-type H+-transporting ATPase subunit A